MNGQCLEITTNEVVKVCSADQGLLSATTNGTVLSAEWTPVVALASPFNLNTSILTPLDTTYTLKVKGFLDSDNLMTNGDFSEGNLGFTSQYESESNNPGGYIIGRLGTELFAEAAPCTDHTSAETDGNMFMVRAAPASNLDIYCQEIAVAPNQAYHFQGFATGLVSNNPPTIVLKINDEVVAMTTLDSLACAWQKVQADWHSGDTRTAKICLSINPTTTANGADFALDDVGFYEVCEAEKKVAVEVTNFTVNLPEQVSLTCGDSLRLRAEIIPGDIFFLTEWETTNGNFVSGERTLFPIIDAVGEYELSVITSIDEQICQTTKTIEVISDIDTDFGIYKSADLHCQQEEVQLEATGEFDQSAYLYHWSSIDGQILSPTTLPMIQVNQPGLYQLERTNLQGNCPQTVEVAVEETSLQAFSFDLLPPDCETPTGTIFFEEIIRGEAPFLYSIDNGATFLPDPIFSNLVADTYDLVVQDVNGCQASQQIDFAASSIVQLALPSKVQVKPTDNFQLPLVINLTDSLIETIEWSPAMNLSCHDCVQPTLISQQSQNFEVIVTDKNGCIAQASIQIEVIAPSDVYIPSAFSPNQDGQNDFFQIHINQERIKKVNRFNVFDRYGSLIYSQHDFSAVNNIGWDGFYKNRLMPNGVYIYWVELERMDGTKTILSGEVGLLR